MSGYDYVIEQKHIPSTDPRLSRHIYHDSRSKNYPFPTSGLTLVNTEHTRHIPPLNQGDVGACVGNAAISNLATDPLFQNLPTAPAKTYTLDENGALHVYSDCEVLDGDGPYPPNDYGTYGLSAAKVLLSAGYIVGYQHTFTLNDALLALTVNPIMVGMNWYDNMFYPDADGRVHLTGALAGGHEVEAYKLDVDNQRVWFHNSWGADWGLTGDFYLTWADLGTLLNRQGDVTVLLPLTAPAPVPAPVPDPAPTPAPTGTTQVNYRQVGKYTVSQRVGTDVVVDLETHNAEREAIQGAQNQLYKDPKADIFVKPYDSLEFDVTTK
jgi:hypothetical protein